MSEREIEILRCYLKALEERHGRPASEIELHAATNMKLLPPKASLVEFNAARDHADQQGLATGLASQTTGRMQWSITDKGRATLVELQS